MLMSEMAGSGVFRHTRGVLPDADGFLRSWRTAIADKLG